MGFRVIGFRGYRVSGLGFGALGLGFLEGLAWGLGLVGLRGVSGLVFRVQRLGSWVLEARRCRVRF